LILATAGEHGLGGGEAVPSRLGAGEVGVDAAPLAGGVDLGLEALGADDEQVAAADLVGVGAGDGAPLGGVDDAGHVAAVDVVADVGYLDHAGGGGTAALGRRPARAVTGLHVDVVLLV